MDRKTFKRLVKKAATTDVISWTRYLCSDGVARFVEAASGIRSFIGAVTPEALAQRPTETTVKFTMSQHRCRLRQAGKKLASEV